MPSITIPSRNYNKGTTNFGPLAIPDGISSISLLVTRENWPVVADREIILVDFEFSVDGGISWGFPGHFGTAGGVIILRDGTTAIISGLADIPVPIGANRQLRGSATVTARLSTSVTMSWN